MLLKRFNKFARRKVIPAEGAFYLQGIDFARPQLLLPMPAELTK